MKGIYDAVKGDGEIVPGKKVYWDETEQKTVTTAGTNKLLGNTALKAKADATVVRVRSGRD